MLAIIRNHKRKVSLFMLFSITQGLFVDSAKALTTGPSQPETQQFAPAGMDNLVDPFTGDFSYNIPLMDVGGYPINLNYASGITPDAEASWVGLGWNVNVGAINRNMRGLPDDFAGEEVIKEYNVKPNQTFGVSGDVSIETYGVKVDGFTPTTSNSVNADIFYNTYNGFGFKVGGSPDLGTGKVDSKFSANLGIGVGSESGVEISPTIGLSNKQSNDNSLLGYNGNIGFAFSSREGLKGMTLSGGLDFSKGKFEKAVDPQNNKVTNAAGAGLNLGSFSGFATPTYSPSIEHNMYNVSGTLSFDFDYVTNPATDGFGVGFSGYYTGQFLSETERKTKAYGYMYSGASQSEDKLLDFNREKDGGYNKYTQNLGVTNFTYDVFQVSGQGVGGAYRLYRGDVGAVHDPITKDAGYTGSLGGQFGVGVPPGSKFGVDGGYSQTNSKSGKWPEGRSSIAAFATEATTQMNKPNKEVVYFKRIGEMAAETDNYFFNNVQYQDKVLSHDLAESTKFLGDGELTADYLVKDYDVINNLKGLTNEELLEKLKELKKPINNDTRDTRVVKTTAFTTLTAAEATKSNIMPIQDYTSNEFTWHNKGVTTTSVTTANTNFGYKPKVDPDNNKRLEGTKKANHISEVRVTDNSGARYIYGIPAYNNHQEEVTFAVKKAEAIGNLTAQQVVDKRIKEGIVKYENLDASIGNKNGLDHMYSKTVTPGYAHSYLLTAVLSADYVDRDNIAGPSDGDLGTYTKFNYSKVIETYKWRTPYSAGGHEASYSQGMQTNENDDKGNYVYGEKEIWYLHSIETKTHVAEFHLSDRHDGLGVVDKNGGINTGVRQKKLDKIVLYAKADRKNSNPEPIKVVHFKYDYLLSPGTPNSDAPTNSYGKSKCKLTLTKVFFTYGRSNKGVLNPYVFNYADQNFDGVIEDVLNPAYSIKNYDRWGNYKVDDIVTPGNSNAEFPYSTQNKNDADKYASVYALSSIKTPTGGELRVSYESDDYAYVQDRRAMRMFKVLGMRNYASGFVANTLDDKQLYDNSLVYNVLNNVLNKKLFLLVDLGEGFKSSLAHTSQPLAITANENNEFRKQYLQGIKVMYYKFYINVINGLLPSDSRNEFVPGYAEIDASNSQIDPTSWNGQRFTRAFIKLKDVQVTYKFGLQVWINPIVKSGWMFARMYLNRELSASADAEDNGLEQVLRSLLSVGKSYSTYLNGFGQKMFNDKHSLAYSPERSFVRLNEPDKIKLGGGHRVKAIAMVDNWANMKGVKEAGSTLVKETAMYGQKYNYSFEENGKTISAGVAAYEPALGNEENPFRLPKANIVEKVPLLADKEFYSEEPYGESFFPAPVVGYRQVTVTPIKVTNGIDLDNNAGNGTGYVKHEFYTAQDFPTIVDEVKLRSERHKPNIIFKFMKFDSKDLVTCTQGYSIELNDMHGKAKRNTVYPEYQPGTKIEDQNAISEVSYTYKSNGKKLINKVDFVNEDLSINRASNDAAPLMGVDIDLVEDERFYESETRGGGLDFNLKYIQYAAVPTLVPTFFPDYNYSATRFRSVVTTKVINKYGILETTTAKDNGAEITTKNLAWDQKTGQVLLTETQNEFHDPIYSFTYPGHWSYERMHLASENEGMIFSTPASVSSYIKDGDEVALVGSTVLNAYYDGETSKLIDKDGENVISSYAYGKVVRSGARNIATTPVGTVVTLENPIKAGNTKVAFDKVINTGINEYNELWHRFCNCGDFESDPNKTKNPFVLGTKGNIRPWRNWTYLTNRTQTLKNDNVSVRNDGIFTDYTPFWQYQTLGGKSMLFPPLNTEATKWQFITQIEKYNPVGMAIEEQDALNRFSMAQYGYGRVLQVAGSNNSEYRETGFDGFEDYDYGDCEDDHFSWKQEFYQNLTNKHSHTGRKSIAVPAGSTKVKINKVIVPCPSPVITK